MFGLSCCSILCAPLAAVTEALFLALYLWWASGRGPPISTQAAHHAAFRKVRLSPGQWVWGLVAAIVFAATIHAAIVLLFRLVPFPAAAFRQGYDFSFIPSRTLQWLAVVVSATSAGIAKNRLSRLHAAADRASPCAPTAICLSLRLLYASGFLTKGWWPWLAWFRSCLVRAYCSDCLPGPPHR